jgi:hypothetical protein
MYRNVMPAPQGKENEVEKHVLYKNDYAFVLFLLTQVNDRMQIL